MSKATILEGATRILDQGTYGDLTVDALARALHMSKSTLYKYFASKEDVVVALVDGVCAQTEADLDGTDALRSGSATAALERLVGLHAAHGERLPRAIVLSPDKLPAACQARLDATRRRLLSSAREIVGRGATSGAFKFGRRDIVAHALIAGAEALVVAGARGDLDSDRGASVKALGGLLAPGLAG